jgi:uncharacterized membrane protein YhdT
MAPMTQSFPRSPFFLSLRVKYTTIILGFLLFMVVGDGLNVVLMRTGQPFWRVSIVIRALAQSYFLLLLANKRQSFYVFGLSLALLAIWLLGSVTSGQTDAYNWFENLNMIVKMVFFFVCWEIFRQFFQKEAEQVRLFGLYEKIIILQALLIIIGFSFHLELLSSYGQEYRFGYKGLLPARNEVSGFFIIAFFYYLWKLYCTKRGIVELFIILTAAFLTGAKAILILPVALVFFLVRWFLRHPRNKIFYIIVGVSVLLIGIAVWQRDNILEHLRPSLQYFSYQLESGNNPTFFSALTTGRSEYVQTLLSGLMPGQLFFGGHDLAVSSTETDLLDVFLFLGITGVLLFYAFYLRALFYNARRRLSFVQILFVLTWLGISTVSGHLVFSAINAPYLAILILAFSAVPQFKITPSRNLLPKFVWKRHSV